MSWAATVALWQERVTQTAFVPLEGQKDSHVVNQPSAGGHGLCSYDNNPVVPALRAMLYYEQPTVVHHDAYVIGTAPQVGQMGFDGDDL